MLAKNQKDWLNKVRAKYKNKCAKCKRWFPDNMLTAHHLLTKGNSPELRLEIDNGIAVCQRCHDKIHRGLL